MNQKKMISILRRPAAARAWRRAIALAFMVALALLGGLALVPRTARAVGNCAGGGTPCIEFLVTGYTSGGNPIIGGPASTAVEIMGGGFTKAENKKISFGIIKGDDILGSPPSPTFCERSHINVGVSTLVTATGTFPTVTFYWPEGTSVGDWSVCAYLAGTNTPATGTSNTDNLAFPVSSPYRPTVSVSPTMLASSGVVTVKGRGWLPAQNGITVTIRACAACSEVVRYGNAVSSSSGNFSVQLTIPAGLAHGKYLVRAMGSVIPDSSSETGPYLTIGIPATATPRPKPTATPRPKPTATPRPTSTTTLRPTSTATIALAPTATPGVIIASGSGNLLGGSSFWLYLGLGALVVLIGGGVLAFALIRRRSV